MSVSFFNSAKFSLSGAAASARSRQRRARYRQRAEKSAPACRHVRSPVRFRSLVDRAVRAHQQRDGSLICSMVSTLLAPNRGIFEHGYAACEL